jgi:glycosyltransferase involved in cell wall biosynthesis
LSKIDIFDREKKRSATVVITTKNRKEDLAKCLASILTQTVPLQILVIDDGSTDGTAELVRQEFPRVELHRSENSSGYIVQRNRAAGLAETPFIFSMDDDAIFSSPRVVEQTLRDFDNPRIGAVAIPFVDVNTSPEVKQQAPDAGGVYAAYSFIGTAHALRKDLFLGLGGYRELLVHQSEEEDYSIRLLNAGYIVRCGRSDPIHHFESPRRSWARMDYHGARNKVMYAWNNVPFPYFPVHLAVTTFMTSIQARQPGRALTRWRGVADAYARCLTARADRRPVAPAVYRLSRELKRRGAVPLREIETRLPKPI